MCGRSSRRASISTARRSEEHTSELQSQSNLVCRLLLEKKKPHKNFPPQNSVGIYMQDMVAKQSVHKWGSRGHGHSRRQHATLQRGSHIDSIVTALMGTL